MNRLILSVGGVAAALVIAVVGVAHFYGPSGPGGPRGPVFTSERHGYSIQLPDDSWRVIERPGTWSRGTFIEAGAAPGTDSVEHLGPDGQPVWGNLYVNLNSQPIPAGMTFADWAAEHDAINAASAPCFKLDGSHGSRTVGGQPARIGVYRCENYGGGVNDWITIQTLVEHGGRAYTIYFWPVEQGPDPERPPLADLQLEAEGWLDRISFTD